MQRPCNVPEIDGRHPSLPCCNGVRVRVSYTYIDDVIIFSSTLEEHLERFRNVLQRFRSAGLNLKPHLLKHSVLFLGHLVSNEGISTDPPNVSCLDSGRLRLVWTNYPVSWDCIASNLLQEISQRVCTDNCTIATVDRQERQFCVGSGLGLRQCFPDVEAETVFLPNSGFDREFILDNDANIKH